MSRWTPTALLVPVRSVQGQVDRVFLQTREELLALFPGARVHHVGSTSLAPALTRGIIDIELQVEDARVQDAQAMVSASDKASQHSMPTRILVHGTGQPSQRLQIRQTLAAHPLLLGEFIGIQKEHVHRLRDPYPRAKAAFFASLLQSPEFADASTSSVLPYRIELQTERLYLESALSCDAREIAQFRQANRKHIEAIGGVRADTFYTEEHLEKSLAMDPILCWRKRALNLLVRRKSDKRLIGICNFAGFLWGNFRACNLGYVVDKEAEGKGYMSEACAVALDYIYSEWGVHRVQAVYDVENKRSAALAERLGLSVEGTAKDYICLDGRWRDGVIASLVR